MTEHKHVQLLQITRNTARCRIKTDNLKMVKMQQNTPLEFDQYEYCRKDLKVKTRQAILVELKRKWLSQYHNCLHRMLMIKDQIKTRRLIQSCEDFVVKQSAVRQTFWLKMLN